MSKKIELKIITPEKLILEDMVDEVLVPTTEGELGILPMHIPIIARLKSGDVVAMANNEHIPIAVVGGFLEVKTNPATLNTSVVILADFAEHISEISDEVIAQAKLRSEELQQQMKNNEVVDFEHFATELERSLTRIKIADKWRTKKYRK